MFLTLTLPSYGPIVPGTGTPAAPASYDYRRAALDALHFPKLVDRFWQNLRRSAGYRVQYFAAVEPQKRLAPHLHAAIRGAIPRATLRQVVKATYVQVWWPPHDQPVYVDPDSFPVWDGDDYVDPRTGEVLPTWDQALDQLDADPDARPVHVMRFGTQTDMRGIIAPSPDADRAVRYLVKYLTKSVAETYADPDDDERRPGAAHRPAARRAAVPAVLAAAVRTGSATASNPTTPDPGMRPGWCSSKAHDRENLGLGGRRVLVSRQWSGKTLDRAPRRPRRRRPRSPGRGRDRRPRDRTTRRRRPLRRRASRGSCGPTPNPTRSSTPESSSPPSPNGNAGKPNTKPRRPPDSLWTVFRQPGRRRDACERPISFRPPR